MAGRRHFDPSVAQELYDETENNRSEIARIGNFADNQERARVLDVYTTGLAAIKEHMQRMLDQGK